MREELIALLKEKLGENPTPEAIVTYLENSGLTTSAQIRKALVIHHFPRMLTCSHRSARDIEIELATRYGVSQYAIWQIRRRRTGVK